MRTRAFRQCVTPVVVAVLLGTLMMPAAAAADAEQSAPPPVSVSAAVTYTVDPDAARVRVSARVTIRHRGETGAVSEVSLALPRSAAALAAERNGVSVEATRGVIEGEVQVWSFALGREVAPGRTAELSLTYALEQATGPRVASPTRLNSAYVSFPVAGLGDAGAGSVRVLMPSWYATRWVDTADLGVTPVEYTAGLARVFEVIGVGAEFVGVVEGRDDTKLVRRAVAVEGTDAVVEIAAWPTDGTWAAVTGAKAAYLINLLEESIGLPWPLTGPLVVRETNAGLVHGFGGSFVRSTDGGGEIEVGPILVDRVLAHELAHAWFDDRLDPWLAEGLAAEFARVVSPLESNDNPVDRSDVAALPLDAWEPFAGSSVQDRYAYGAAEQVVHSLTLDLSSEQRRSVVDILISGRSAFQTGVGASVDLEDWQRFLDASASVGVTDRSDEAMLAEWVLSNPPRELLDERYDALWRMIELRERAGDWDLPLAVPLAMTQWTFGTAQRAMDAAESLLDQRDQVASRAATLGVELPTDARDAFAQDALLAVEALRDQADVLDALERAIAVANTDRSWMESVGLWGYDEVGGVGDVRAALSDGAYEDAIRATEALERRRDRAARDGERRVAGVGAGLLTLALLILLVSVGRSRRRHAAG